MLIDTKPTSVSESTNHSNAIGFSFSAVNDFLKHLNRPRVAESRTRRRTIREFPSREDSPSRVKLEQEALRVPACGFKVLLPDDTGEKRLHVTDIVQSRLSSRWRSRVAGILRVQVCDSHFMSRWPASTSENLILIIQ